MMSIFKDFLLQLTVIATLIFTFQIFFAEKSERNARVKIILSALFGSSIVLCMSFPVQITSNIHIDIRIIPLLLGTLYCGMRTGLALSVLIMVYRWYLGADLGLYTTTLALLFSMPVIFYYQKFFAKAKRKKKIHIALLLSAYYCFVGVMATSMIRGFSYKVFQVQLIYIMITLVIVLLFTALIETIKDTIRKNQQLQSDVKDAEIAFLRSQINPHFLYNTLSSIAALCIDEPHKAGELTMDLSQYLRSSIHFKQHDSLTTVENELELVNAYINIEKVRFGARLHVEYNVNARPDLRIPPMILQPLVENAIRHGLMSNLRGGTVKISIQEEANAAVRFAVEDNGCGMSEKKQEELLQPDDNKKGVGLWNISRRIRLQYGTNLRIHSAEGMGTKVFFDIPAQPLQH